MLYRCYIDVIYIYIILSGDLLYSYDIDGPIDDERDDLPLKHQWFSSSRPGRETGGNPKSNVVLSLQLSG